MTNLVAELKAEHQKLVAVLTDVKAKGVTTKEGVQALMQAKGAVLAHLKKEDTFLYPEMRMAAEKNPQLKQTLEIFAKDMEKVTTQVLEFFGKYQNGGTGIEFAKDLGAVMTVLANRIQREESALYPEFDKLKSGKVA
jgi:iron-sulfur cluster repair protein YtfE (RIC family)